MVKDYFISLDSIEHHTGMRRLKDNQSFFNADYFIIYSFNADMILRDDYNSYFLSAGSILFLPGRRLFTIGSNSDASPVFYILYISGAAAAVFFRQCSNIPMQVPANSEIPDMLRRLNYLKTSILPADKQLAMKLTVHLLTEITFLPDEITEKTVPPHVAAIRKLFDENPAALYSLNDLAALTHISKYKLSKDFKEAFGVPPMQYLLELRVQEAKILLLSTDETVADISKMTGFSDPNYFVHIFKKKTGLTPTKFRKSSV